MAEVFNTVIRGYKKEQVTAYIADLNEQMQLLKNDLDRKDVEIVRLQCELQEANDVEKEPNEDQLAEIRAQIREEIEAEIRAEYENKAAEEVEVTEEATIEEAVEQVPVQTPMSELERKAREYDESKDVLAELLIQARKSADEIVGKAEAKAQFIRAQSEIEFSQLCNAFSLLQQNVGNIRGELQANMDQISDQFAYFEKTLANIEAEIDKTLGRSGEKEQ